MKCQIPKNPNTLKAGHGMGHVPDHILAPTLLPTCLVGGQMGKNVPGTWAKVC